MRPETLSMLRSPIERAPLRLASFPGVNGERLLFLVNDEHGIRYPIRDGIPVFVEPHQVSGMNARFRRIYDNWAPFYDLLSRVGLYVLGVSERELRRHFVAMLEISNGDAVLSTSVGTGSDLAFLPRDCRYYGLDISARMLQVCRSKMRGLRADAELFLGQAEYLPFGDESFNVVYQMGGINFFSDQRRAIAEMVRVAKPGAKVVIMDETEKVARTLENVPGIGAWFRHSQRPIVPPVHFVPGGMEQFESRELCDGQAWFLSFRKPR